MPDDEEVSAADAARETEFESSGHEIRYGTTLTSRWRDPLVWLRVALAAVVLLGAAVVALEAY